MFFPSLPFSCVCACRFVDLSQLINYHLSVRFIVDSVNENYSVLEWRCVCYSIRRLLQLSWRLRSTIIHFSSSSSSCLWFPLILAASLPEYTCKLHLALACKTAIIIMNWPSGSLIDRTTCKPDTRDSQRDERRMMESVAENLRTHIARSSHNRTLTRTLINVKVTPV